MILWLLYDLPERAKLASPTASPVLATSPRMQVFKAKASISPQRRQEGASMMNITLIIDTFFSEISLSTLLVARFAAFRRRRAPAHHYRDAFLFLPRLRRILSHFKASTHRFRDSPQHFLSFNASFSSVMLALACLYISHVECFEVII